MKKTLLEQLREVTKVVADSGDFDSIVKFKAQDSTTNPSLIAAAARMPAYSAIVDNVLTEAKKELGENANDKDVANLASSVSPWHSEKRFSLSSRAACQPK